MMGGDPPEITKEGLFPLKGGGGPRKIAQQCHKYCSAAGIEGLVLYWGGGPEGLGSPSLPPPWGSLMPKIALL